MYKCVYLCIHGCTQHVNTWLCINAEWECIFTYVYPFVFLQTALCVCMVCMPVSLLLDCMCMPFCVDVYVCGRVCKPSQAYNCLYTSWVWIQACLTLCVCPHMHVHTFMGVCYDGGWWSVVCWLIRFIANGRKPSDRVQRFLTWGLPFHTVSLDSTRAAEIMGTC